MLLQSLYLSPHLLFGSFRMDIIVALVLNFAIQTSSTGWCAAVTLWKQHLSTAYIGGVECARTPYLCSSLFTICTGILGH